MISYKIFLMDSDSKEGFESTSYSVEDWTAINALAQISNNLMKNNSLSVPGGLNLSGPLNINGQNIQTLIAATKTELQGLISATKIELQGSINGVRDNLQTQINSINNNFFVRVRNAMAGGSMD